ncbi:MAG TPA: ABC transporter substrate-binding protein [Terriglobales bacterium]|nr:ABC transporter substrate-binding protein [Terriglobales bacterium]
MRRSAYLLFAATSLLLVVRPAAGETRPRYGGTLRVEVGAAPSSFDPAQQFAFPTSTQEQLATLMFDRLVEVDQQGTPRPALAASWQHDPDYRRWLFHLREGILLHNGSPLRPHLVVMSLAASNPNWHVRLQGDDIVIESSSPIPDALMELACARNSIVVHTEAGAVVGTGPFRVSAWESGKRLVLTADEDYWGGPPFLDSIEITFGRSQRDQALDLQLARADVVEVPADQIRHVQQEGQRVVASAPAELIALAFSERPSVKDQALREAISLSIDRAAVQSTLLQKQGEAAAGLLPQWVSGYSFLFPVAPNLERARQLRRDLGASPSLTLAYDWSDPLARAIAERVSVNARDASITIQPYGENLSARGANADMRVVRLPLASSDPAAALNAISGATGRQGALPTDSAEELYSSERTLRGDFRLVPIVYVPQAWTLAAGVRDWTTPRQGGWRLAELWLEGGKP